MKSLSRAGVTYSTVIFAITINALKMLNYPDPDSAYHFDADPDIRIRVFISCGIQIIQCLKNEEVSCSFCRAFISLEGLKTS
jgi:hypothetical protein